MLPTAPTITDVPAEKVRLRIGSLAKAVLVTGQAYQDPKDALNEFVSNAADEYAVAGRRGERIRVVLRRRGRHPVIAVDDIGRGMDARGASKSSRPASAGRPSLLHPSNLLAPESSSPPGTRSGDASSSRSSSRPSPTSTVGWRWWGAPAPRSSTTSPRSKSSTGR